MCYQEFAITRYVLRKEKILSLYESDENVSINHEINDNEKNIIFTSSEKSPL